MTFMERLRYEVDLTFNPRTAGAKIAGRCPDTQTRPSEADPDADAAMNATSEGFDVKLFKEALERQMLEQEDDVKEARQASLKAALNAVVIDRDDSELECVIPDIDDDEEDEYGYAFSNESDEPLTGRELALLCYGKYDKFHDMAIKHVKMGSGMRRWVSLNLYVGHLGQRSYPATEETYLEQLDAIAYMITSWGQQQYTRAFFKEKRIARRGLPSTPRVDTCVTLQFSRSPTWDDELGDEYFEFKSNPLSFYFYMSQLWRRQRRFSRPHSLLR